MTYTLIDSVTLASSASSVTFSSISATGKGDLVLAANVKNPASVATLRLTFNGETTGTNYSYTAARGNGSTATALVASSMDRIQPYSVATGDSGIYLFQVFDYSASDKHKSVLIRTDSKNISEMLAGRWASTSAITSVTLNAFNTYSSGDTFFLYQLVSE